MVGIINVSKPTGITSFKTVSIVRKLFGVKKAGHTGTLDPSASGVLPICIGKATRICQFLLNSKKVYLARMKLGVTTDTQDADGKILEEHTDFVVSEDRVKDAISKYKGEIQQIPPMFSAKKIDGKKLYEFARKGVVLEREPKTVEIFSIEFLEMEGDEVLFRAETSPGTYIRTLCDSIGHDLGCGAHLKTLVREKVGSMTIDNAVTIERLRELKKLEKLDEVLIGINEALSFYPMARVDKNAEVEICQGLMISKRGVKEVSGTFKAKEILRVVGPDGEIIALMESLVHSDNLKNIAPDAPIMKSVKVFAD